jgi:hypothetical protein
MCTVNFLFPTDMCMKFSIGALSGFASTVCLQPCEQEPTDILISTTLSFMFSRFTENSDATRGRYGSIKVRKHACSQWLILRASSYDYGRNTTLILRTAQEIVAKDGLVGLWRGTAPSLIRCVLSQFESTSFNFTSDTLETYLV